MVLNLKKIMIFLDGIQKYKLFVTFFIYSVLISLTIQFILLPYILPALHYGNGQMNGGDWVITHQRASVIANDIAQYGWKAWDFRPDGWGVSGLISLHYSIFGINHPALLVPIYSALHALGAFCIVILIEKLNDKRSIAILAAIPYLVFPSSLLWVSQILKDVFTLNASLFILCGLILLLGFSKVEDVKVKMKTQILAFVLIIFGLAIIWWIRSYMLIIYFAFIFGMLFLINILLIISIINKKITTQALIGVMLAQFFIGFSSLYFNDSHSYPSVLGVSEDNFYDGPAVGSSIPFTEFEKNVTENITINYSQIQKSIDEKKYLLNLSRTTGQKVKNRQMSYQRSQTFEENVNPRTGVMTPMTYTADEQKVLDDRAISIFELEPTALSIFELEPTALSISKLTENEVDYQSDRKIPQQKLLDVKADNAFIDELIIEKELALFEAIHEAKLAAKKMMAEIKAEMLRIESELIKEIEVLEQSLYVQPLKNDILKKYEGVYKEAYIHKDWEYTKFLPGIIDSNLKNIYFNRSYFYQVTHSYGSSFDVGIYVNSFSAMLNYAPRALQVAFLSPFPNSWFSTSKGNMPSMFSKIIALEMVMIYIFLIGAIFSLFIWRKKIELWVMILFSVYFALIPVYVFPNFGAIIRYRYAAIMLIVAIGIAFSHYVYINWLRLKNNE